MIGLERRILSSANPTHPNSDKKIIAPHSIRKITVQTKNFSHFTSHFLQKNTSSHQHIKNISHKKTTGKLAGGTMNFI
jgi:hypothetical protein